MGSILNGITVIDLTQFQQGAVATQVLADMGAEVIKIERPEGGMERRMPPIKETGLSAYFQAHNRNKKSIAINLKHPAGREIIYRLVQKGDVFCENFQRGVPERLGVGYEDLAKINPQIIYFSASAFGLKGSMSENPGYDAVGQAMGGILSAIWSPPGKPSPLVGVAVADQTGGFLGALGIILALFHKERTGEGQRVDVSLLGSGIGLVGWVLQAFLFSGVPYQPKSRARINPGGVSISTTHFAKDDKPVIVQIMGRDKLEAAMKVLGIERFLEDPRFQLKEIEKNPDPLLEIFDEAFKKRNRDDWLKIFAEADVVIAPVLNCAEVSSHPQVLANEYIVDFQDAKQGNLKLVGLPIKFSRTPAKVGIAPELGEHTDRVLFDLGGYSPSEIAGFRSKGVIR